MRFVSLVVVTLAIGLVVSGCGRKNLPHPPAGYGNTQNTRGYGDDGYNGTLDNGTLDNGATDDSHAGNTGGSH